VDKSKIRTDLKPVYSDYENALQERNLYGQVKKVEYYKETFQYSGQKDKPILEKVEFFGMHGELTKAVHYDNFGKLLQTNTILYNENYEFIESTTVNESNHSKIHQTVEYDTILKTSLYSIYLNDSLDHKTTAFFGDKKNYPIRRISVKGSDTTEIVYEYEFNHNNKLTLGAEEEIGRPKSRRINHFQYDSIGNLIKSTLHTDWVKMTNETEWKTDRIFRQTSYTTAADSISHKDNITEFDILYNPINSKEFENSELERELKFKYEFDKNGNWIKKNVWMKEHFNNSKDFSPIYVSTRKITYW